MSTLKPITDQELSTLKGRTVIVTGGASGIGKATVLVAHTAGANVVIADVNKTAGEEYALELKKNAIFVGTDVSNWSSVLNLFEQTYQRFGSIDVVFANAGTTAWDSLLEDDLDKATGKLGAPTFKNIEINLFGPLHTVKAAVHYFGKHPEKKCQIIMTGSAASLIDTPPLTLYCTGKAGVLGLMRALRTKLPEKNISINMIAPWMTVTAMLPKRILDTWGDLPANDPDGVARALLIPAVRPEINGRTIWVAGNDAIEVEEALHRVQPEWLGKDLSPLVDEGQKRMGIETNFDLI